MHVLDTHAAIWLVSDDRRLGKVARRKLARSTPEQLIISDYTLTEFARLMADRAVQFRGDPIEVIETFAQRFTIQPVTPWIALRSADYDWSHRDPMDRHILATAEFLNLPLVTTDRKITPFAKSIGVKTIW